MSAVIGRPTEQTDDAPGFDSRAFRDALGTFVTGVTIVTTVDAHGAPAGLTANSFNSVSLDPPLVLWSLALDSTNLAAFRQSSHWAVHVLAAGQEALSNQFARSEGDKFAGVTTSTGPGGIPLLDGCAARFVCRAAFEYEGGDHAIFLGAVLAVQHAASTPLIYHQGSYGGVLPAGRTTGEPPPPGVLERLGLADEGSPPRLTEAGRRVAGALAALATDRMTRHEANALRHLLLML